MIDDVVWCSLMDLNQRSKNTSYRVAVLAIQNALFKFLKENNLVLVKVLDESGAAIPDLELRSSMMTPDGINLFEKTVAAWERARAKDGNYENTAILSKGLEKIRAGK